MEQQKKGMPIWAWFGIGCGVIVVIVIVALVVGGLFVAKKAKDVVGEFEDNPEVAAARMIVRLNPEIEEVSVDEEAGTITVRETATGKQYTVSVADLKDGKFSITGEDGETVFSAEGDPGGQGVTITSGEGEMTLSGGDESAAPEWVPRLEDQKITGQQAMTVNGKRHGNYQLSTGLATDEVVAFYTEALQAEGFEASTNTYSSNEDSTTIVQYRNADDERTLVLTVAVSGGEQTVNVTYTEGG